MKSSAELAKRAREAFPDPGPPSTVNAPVDAHQDGNSAKDIEREERERLFAKIEEEQRQRLPLTETPEQYRERETRENREEAQRKSRTEAAERNESEGKKTEYNYDENGQEPSKLTPEEIEDLTEPDWEKGVEEISIDQLIAFDRTNDPDNRFGN